MSALFAGALLFTCCFYFAATQGNVGCLFSSVVCNQDEEWCFDDYAFGRCQPQVDDDEAPADLYRYNLRREALHMLEREMTRLFTLGYRWNHQYTQCVLQSMLLSIREQSELDDDRCTPLIDQDLNAALRAFEGDEEQHLKPSRIAQVKFTPSRDDPHADFADEVYVPLLQNVDLTGFPENGIRFNDIQETGDDERQALINKLLRLEKPKRSKINENIQSVYYPQTGIFPISDFLPTPSRHFSDKYADQLINDVENDEDEDVRSFSRHYNTPEGFRQGLETKDEKNQFDRLSDSAKRELFYETFGSNVADNPSRELEQLLANEHAGVYTEGGVVYPKGTNEEEKEPAMEDFIKGYTVALGLGFKRPERLDVKKPGPAFNTNNFAFKNAKEPTTTTQKPKLNLTQKSIEHEVATLKTQAQIPAKEVLRLEKKKSPNIRKASLDDANDGYDPVDPSYVYIQFAQRVNSWEDGVKILKGLAELLNWDPNFFSHSRVDLNEVTFKVDPSRFSLNTTEIAKRIAAIKQKAYHALNITITSTGIGDKAKLPISGESTGEPTYERLTDNDDYQLFLLSFLLCGIIAAAAISGAAFFVIRRHQKHREKLNNIEQPDTEASKDYEELCRARMAKKNAHEKSDTAIGRITGLAKEGDALPSSNRSSTSSWTEEPALTNMDISTGHMVLTYMEDHLKNKDRLEQEWIALCAYEAEPCATVVAQKPENFKKNRYPDVLPYDHARVVLNELINATGSDYINASTINDHDPRNPAYIATQGPLPHTAADLWQMVWEQGSVVMVMLTRLSENSTTLCHRYWPEDGSEIYHIYEVHLVSEHIWCDDYLVRSFYLKNLKTGETRTVTQFHFLSWPENGVPLSTKALLEFRRKVNKSYRGRSCPIVVHCSDGVGRSGTYILIDMVLNRMAKGAKEIDIAATLEHIRDQRLHMVKTKQQFEFVLMAVAEEVHAILKALPATHSPPPLVKDKE